jgi:myosin heavy subunit
MKGIGSGSVDKLATIGVLDIFGFESFATNSFEQLCINYCNETLQQHFNQFIFKLEQEEYVREQIDWSQVSFPDNQDCLDLIESKRPAGVLTLLDEQCLLQTGSDEGFARKCFESLVKEHPRFTVSAKQKVAGQFSIRHYAGEVVYTAAGFVEKNKDQIHREATDLLLASRSRSTLRCRRANCSARARSTSRWSITCRAPQPDWRPIACTTTGSRTITSPEACPTRPFDQATAMTRMEPLKEGISKVTCATPSAPTFTTPE